MSTLRCIMYKQKLLADGKSHPVLLTFYINKEYRLSLGYSCTPEKWNYKAGRFNKKMDNFQEKNAVLWQKEVLADKIIQEMALSEKPFSFEAFKEKFRGTNKAITVHTLWAARCCWSVLVHLLRT